MPPAIRKLALTVHVAVSVGWVGAVAAFLALAIAGARSEDTELVRAVYLVLRPITVLVIVPLSLAALATGIVQSVGTNWGLVKHYWVVFKLILTVLAVAVLLLQLEPIGLLADTAAARALYPSDLRTARISLVIHAAGGLIVLLVPLILSVYKPRGRTRFG